MRIAQEVSLSFGNKASSLITLPEVTSWEPSDRQDMIAMLDRVKEQIDRAQALLRDPNLLAEIMNR